MIPDFDRFETVALDDATPALRILDQTLLPGECRMLSLRRQEEIREAICSLRVRGAPAIGVAAAIGLYLAARESRATDTAVLLGELSAAADRLASARPTAVNLSWALGRMLRCARAARSLPVDELRLRLRREAERIREEDIAACRAIGEHGLSLLRPGDGLLTHCNAGRLAAVRYGTATAPMYLAHERGYGLRLYCDETRPLLQGARLTAFELSAAGMDVTLLCDNMAGALMREGKINAVFVGCDRVAANGDTANKIGTSMVAALAARYEIPFYVCAPTSTIDPATPDGDAVNIEQRAPDEVTALWYAARMAPEGVKVYNPAFDITDAALVTAFVTERGIVRPPYRETLAHLLDRTNGEEK